MKEYVFQKFTPTEKRNKFKGALKNRSQNWRIPSCMVLFICVCMYLFIIFNSVSENGRGRKLKYGEFC